MDLINDEIPINSSPTYTLEGLLQKACIASQQQVFTKIDGVVRVKGIVTKVNRYPKVAYLTLVDREYSISVKFDAEQTVVENQAIIVEGVLLLKPSTFFTGLESYIDGHIIGSWVPTKLSEGNILVPLKKSRFVHLDDFLQEHPLDSLMIMGTDTALTDVFSHMDSGLAAVIPKRLIRVSKKESLLNEIASDLTSNIKALAIVRGGDDKTMQIWDDHEIVNALLRLGMPYYTALGHSHSTTLADRYADGTFHTPSAMGMALNSSVSRIKKINDLLYQCQSLEQENAQLTSHNFVQRSNLSTITSLFNAALLGSFITIGIYVIVKYIL